MSDIEKLLNKLGGEFRFDTGHVLLNLIQYSIRNKKYLELLLKNQLEIKEALNGNTSQKEEILDQQFDQLLDDIQQDVEKEYFDLLSFLVSRNSSSDEDKDH